MKNAFHLTLAATLLAISISDLACAEELVITLNNGRTIVLDTAEIKSMAFSKSGETIRLIPSPRNFSRGERPPGTASVTFRPTSAPDGNLGVSITLTDVLPNHRYNLYLYVDGRNVLGRPVTSVLTDPTGCGHSSTRVPIAAGERTFGISVTSHDSEGDIYVTPGIYKNGGTVLRIEPFRRGGEARPRR